MTTKNTTASGGRIKRTVRTLHRWLGLVSGILIVVVALTGCLLAFEDEGRDYLMHDYYHLGHPGVARLSLDRIVDTFRVHYPKTKVNSIRFKEKADAAFVVFTKDRYIFMDPYTATIIADIPVCKDFFTSVRILHTELFLGPVGKTIVHYNVLLFLIILLSGLVLWWPKKWRFVKKAVSIDFRTNNRKRLNFDLHRALGFYALPVLLIITFTGLFMAFDATKSLVAFVTHSPAPAKEEAATVEKPAAPDKPLAQPKPAAQPQSAATAKHKSSASIDSAYTYARTQYPGALETFVTPAAGKSPIRIVMRYPFNIVRQQNTFSFHPNTGALLKADLYADYNAYDKVARSNYNLHTGKIGFLGIFGKIIYLLAALCAASLPITGFLIYYNRTYRKSKRISGTYPARKALTTDLGVSTVTNAGGPSPSTAAGPSPTAASGPGTPAAYPPGDHL